MYNIHARNVSEALAIALPVIRKLGKLTPSRGGMTLEMPMPVSTTYVLPKERVLFCADRDANPFFHLIEAIWMLGGRNDVKTLARYNSNMRAYATNGFTLNGAYGHRWRRHFGYDQLNVAVSRLKNIMNDRRTVIAMHDPRIDLVSNERELDQPCNTHLYLKVRDGKLNMMVCCRSNDMIWGAYGANAVHFSVLLEYLAARIGVGIGTYTQISDSFHAYTDILARLDQCRPNFDPYLHIGEDGLHYYPGDMFTHPESADEDIELFLEKETTFSDVIEKQEYVNPFFNHTLEPMRQAYLQFKNKNIEGALSTAYSIKAVDWRVACTEWLQRRNYAKQTAVAG